MNHDEIEPAAELVGGTDIYLLDLILRGGVARDARVLDAGCGLGRNIRYLMATGRTVSGLDPKPEAINEMRRLAATSGKADVDNFRVESLEEASFDDGSFDLVVCNAVLHFSRNEDHFRAMTTRIRDLLAPGGLAFCRLASDVGITALLEPCPDRPERWCRLPDGSDRFVVDLDFLLAETDRLGVELAGAIKTVNVQNRRCMSTWIFRR